MFLHIFGFESSGEKAHCLHGGAEREPQSRKVSPQLFQGLEL